MTLYDLLNIVNGRKSWFCKIYVQRTGQIQIIQPSELRLGQISKYDLTKYDQLSSIHIFTNKVNCTQQFKILLKNADQQIKNTSVLVLQTFNGNINTSSQIISDLKRDYKI